MGVPILPYNRWSLIKIPHDYVVIFRINREFLPGKIN